MLFRSVDRQYLFDSFGDTTSADSFFSVTATLIGTASSFALTDELNGKLVRHFQKQDGFQFCGSDSAGPSDCVTLWRGNSTVGSAVPVEGGGFVAIREFHKFFPVGALDYHDVLVIEGFVPKDAILKKHRMTFVSGIGLVQHVIEEIERETFQFLSFKSIDLAGFKIGDLQRGRLDGIDGAEFSGLNLGFQFIQPADFEGPLTISFHQKRNDGSEVLLSYGLSADDTEYSTRPIEDVLPGFEN